jgi:hypothetical protein
MSDDVDYEYYDDFDASWARRNPAVYHGGKHFNPSEFMKSPILHVGTVEQANQIIQTPESYLDANPRKKWPGGRRRFRGVHKLNFSQFAEFHPHIMHDSAVNTAQRIHLEEMNAPVSSSVEHTSKSYSVDPDVQAVLSAFRQNKIVPYINDYETPRDEEGGSTMWADDVEHISYAVPAPTVNLIGPRKRKDPLTQPTLPMDLTNATESQWTKAHREDNPRPKKNNWKIEEV